jgi:hypothetical protein
MWLRRTKRKTVSFAEEEEKRIDDVLSKLRKWSDMVKGGVLGEEVIACLKQKITNILDLCDFLYSEYVPPFEISKKALSEAELRAIINELKMLGGFLGWLRLDGSYYTVDMDTFKKIVEWDFTDTRKYLTDTFDCDKFAMYFKSRLALDFGINAVGVVLDYSAGHAYNLVILKDSQTRWYLYEPQDDSIFTYNTRDVNMYAMKSYVLLL